jgi:plastocyanin
MLSEGVIAMKLARILALSLTMLFLAACGGDGATPASPGQTTEPASGTTLVMKDNMFEPADFTIQSGTRITLKNEGAALHNLTVEGQDFNKDVNPGETENEDFEIPAGSYTMFCRFHRAQGMEGTLTVTG